MAFPDRIERTVEVAHPPHTVWAALTTAEGWVPGSVTRPRSTCARPPRPACLRTTKAGLWDRCNPTPRNPRTPRLIAEAMMKVEPQNAELPAGDTGVPAWGRDAR
jgi:hypothetical protein